MRLHKKKICFSLFIVLLALYSLTTHSALFPPTQTKIDYPDEWWRVVPPEEKEWWEVLPQEAERSKNEVILSKRTSLGILSNLASTPFTLDGVQYASIEGLWQSLKYPDPDDPKDPRRTLSWLHTREEVRRLSGFEAKNAGEATRENYKKLGLTKVSYRGKWMDYKGKDKQIHYRLIFQATTTKIRQNKDARDILLATQGLTLLPDHKQDPNAPPAYRYYDILSKIRRQLFR